MKTAVKLFFLIGVLFFLSNCVDETAIIKKEATFFDLKEYIVEQSEILSQKKEIVKVTSIDGDQIEKKLDSIDFTQELEVFEESDINKLAWLDKYTVDSTYNKQGELDQIAYKAIDEKLRTRELLISFNENEVDTISIYNNASGKVAKLEQRLRYIPNQGYSIESIQKTTFSKEHVVLVDVRFLR